jgi:radical SAM superfamily enzyme YgiQ (UPF0313 family)
MQNGSFRLLLINPANQAKSGYLHDRTTCMMPLGLGIVAALTPPDWEVELLDEGFEEFVFRPADLVAFTGFTASAPRAYEIAAVYREKGIHTVMGGIHASMCPEEAMNFVDSVVTGEAEGAWAEVIADFKRGEMKKLYEGGIGDIQKVPHARRDIFKYPYAHDLVQTSRGCPWGCDFCSVTRMCGKTFRERDVEDVLDELEMTSRPLLFFIDDNLVNNRKGAGERAIRLFRGMVERGIRKYWISQAALNFGDDDEVLYWAKKSGCMMILMGIEAEKTTALEGVSKKLNLKRGISSYNNMLKNVHRYGIGITASLIFGLESDRKEDLYARGRYLLKSSFDGYQCTILTPLPGTVLYDRLKEQGRIILTNYPDDWQHYHFTVGTVNMPHMKAGEITDTMHRIWPHLYSKMNMRRKMFRTLWNTRSFVTAYRVYGTNHVYGRIACEGNLLCDEPSHWVYASPWKNGLQWLYLKFTDKVIWVIYKLFWSRMIKEQYGYSNGYGIWKEKKQEPLSPFTGNSLF